MSNKRAVLINKLSGHQASSQNEAHLKNLLTAEAFAQRGDGGLPVLLLAISKTRAGFVTSRSPRALPADYSIWLHLVKAFLNQAKPGKRNQSAKAFVWWLRKSVEDKGSAAYRLTRGTKISSLGDRLIQGIYTTLRKMQS